MRSMGVQTLLLYLILFLLNIFIPQCSSGQIVPYKNPEFSVEERVNDLIQRMTIEEKVNQMLKVEVGNLEQDEKGRITRESLDNLFKGQSFGSLDYPPWIDINNVTDIEGIAGFSQATDQYSRENTRLGIPVIQLELGGMHGPLVKGATIFPQVLGQGSTWNRELIKKMAQVIAREASLVGYDQAFAPLFDLARDPRYGRVEECFGEDPFLVGEMGKAFVIGMQGDPEITKDYIQDNHLISTAKHYVGYSVPIAGINKAPVEVGPRDLRNLYLYPFEKAVREANVYSIMPSYNELNGIPMHANKHLLRDVLRKEFGFEGYVFADYSALEMMQTTHKITTTKAETAVLALKAGIDHEGSDYSYSKLIDLAKQDRNIEVLVDDAVRNILRVKFKAGLFDKPYRVPKNINKLVHTEKDVKLARQVAEESIILLKNHENLLPLNLSDLKSIAVIGPNADQVQYGDYSLTIDNATGVTVLEGIKNIVKDKVTINYARGCDISSLDNSGFEEAINAAEKSDVVILVIGGTSNLINGIAWDELPEKGVFPTSGEEFDRAQLTPPGIQPELIQAIYKTGKPIVMVMVHGRAYSIKWEKEHIPAILDAWYPGEQGGNAIADILFGKVSPSGKLTVSVPQSAGHVPVFYNYKPTGRGVANTPGSPRKPGKNYVFSSTEPLFPFGFGLSYTQFEYSDLVIDQKELMETDSIKLSVRVKNIGDIIGKEVIQVYINDVVSSVTTPVMVLKEFKKEEIAPGETITLTFSIPCYELGIWDQDMNYVIEPGKFEIMIGASAEDIRLRDSIKIIKR